MLTDKQPILDLLKQCRGIKHLHQIHCHAITIGLLFNYSSLLLPNILQKITLLATTTGARASSSSRKLMMDYAVSVFHHITEPTTFCYNTMMRANTLLSSPANALLLFTDMRRRSIAPDSHTFPFVLKATGRLRAVSVATALHSMAFQFGFISDLFVLNSFVHIYSITNRLYDACRLFEESSYKDVVSYNALIDGFVKAGDTQQARQLFDEMPVRDAVSWGTLMAGYAQMNKCKEAIDLFNTMLHCPSGVCPDNIALVAVLSACAQLGDLEQGMAVHYYIMRKQIRVDNFLSTSLVDLYAKCGCIEIAVQVFESSSDKNIYTWNVMLVGLAMQGYGKTSLDYFSRMINDGIQPDGVSFLGVLVGCSHAGLVDEARKLFDDMESVYDVPGELKHYGCMTDLLCRAGLIKEALVMIEGMPIKGDIYVWGSLLGGCRVHGLLELAEKVAAYVMELSPEDGGVYSIMANVYANASLWDDVARTRSLMKTKMVKKNAGCSLIKLNGIIHEFIAGDDLHPQSDEIYMVLNRISSHQSEGCLE